MMILLRFSSILAILSALLASAGEPKILFEDKFDAKLTDGWSWLRENPAAWRIKDRGMEIRIEPGLADTVKNALLRKAPDRSKKKYYVETTVVFLSTPTQQYEQAGITWYHRGKPVLKLVHERIDGKNYIIPGKIAADSPTVQLRLTVSADKYIAQFRPDGKGDYQTVAEGSLPEPGEDQVSLQCYNGPEKDDHWMRFENFRIVEATADSSKP